MFADSHTHSRASFDGKASAARLAEEALKNGVGLFTVTDHCDLDGILAGFYPPYDPKAEWADVAAAREQFHGRVEIGFGVELGQPHLAPEAAANLLREHRFDFVIGSVHNLADMPDFAFLDYRDMPQALIDDLLARSLREAEAVASVPGIHTLAHVTYPCRYIRACGREVNLSRFRPMFESLFRVLMERNVALEFNIKMLREGGEPDPTPEVLRWYREAGGRLVSVGSDAHAATDCGRMIRDAYALLASLGFRHVMAGAPGGVRMLPISQ